MTRPVTELSAPDFASALGRGDVVALLDVREPWERSACAIAVPSGVRDLHIPVGSIVNRLGAIREASQGVTLVVYCHHGVRSRMVAEWLASQGIGPVANLSGGIDAWSIRVDREVARY